MFCFGCWRARVLNNLWQVVLLLGALCEVPGLVWAVVTHAGPFDWYPLPLLVLAIIGLVLAVVSTRLMRSAG